MWYGSYITYKAFNYMYLTGVKVDLEHIDWK